MLVNPFWVFFGLEGRLIRAHWWFALSILALAFILVSGLLHHHFEVRLGLPETTALNARIGLISLLTLIYPMIAVCQKRLQDRGWDQAGVIVLVGGLVGTLIVLQSGIVPLMPAGWFIWECVAFVGIALTVWALVEMAWFSSENGDNDFGPDPFGESPARYRWDTTQRAAKRPAKLPQKIKPKRSASDPSQVRSATKLPGLAQRLLGQSQAL